MQRVRTLAAWRPDLTDYGSSLSAYWIALKSLARRHLELQNEIADLDDMIVAIVDQLAPDPVARSATGHGSAAQAFMPTRQGSSLPKNARTRPRRSCRRTATPGAGAIHTISGGRRHAFSAVWANRGVAAGLAMPFADTGAMPAQ